MARKSNRIAAAGEGSKTSFRRAGGLVTSAGLLCALVVSGCASVNIAVPGTEASNRIDIFIATTDRTTANEVLGRLQGLENLTARQAGKGPWYRGHLTGRSDGSVYTILVGQVEGGDDTKRKAIMSEAIRVWRPRYVLVLGTTPAVAYNTPLGAVGLVILTCKFDLDRYEQFGDAGYCHRPDGGLYSAALSVADEWETAATTDASRVGCDPARVLKMVALSENGSDEPRLVKTATKLSEERHRGMTIERERIFAAQVIKDLRHEMKEPMGFLMIRGVSEVLGPGTQREDTSQANEPGQLLLDNACAARDTADFAVELISRAWPVSPRAER
jgi:hypothetical protein